MAAGSTLLLSKECHPCVNTSSLKIKTADNFEILYFALRFFNILFAWLGLIDFVLPLIFAIAGGNKWFCNHMCGRGQLFWVLGRNLKCSRRKKAPAWISSKWFRYGFLTFFMTMFGTMIFQTYLVFSGAGTLRKAIKLFWTFKVPWKWAYNGSILPDWVAQFGFGFYSLMLTSTLIGLIVMALYKGVLVNNPDIYRRWFDHQH